LERDDQAATRRWSANKPKEMKGNERKIAFISFYFLFGIGTFQWVTGDSNKKIKKLPVLFPSGRRIAAARPVLLLPSLAIGTPYQRFLSLAIKCQ
jgi:hypothetical protein